MRIINSIIFIGLGIAMIKYNYQIVRMTGKMDWVEQKICDTYTFVKLMGMLVAFFGFISIFGAETGIIRLLVGWMPGVNM